MFRKKQYYTCAVIPAAGSSSRMGGENKLLIELDGIPILVRTIFAFEHCDEIHEIILACREQDIIPYGRLIQAYGFQKVSNLVRGGKSRTESVLAGVRACPDNTELIAIHDGARPFITPNLIAETVKSAAAHGAAAPVIPLKDSIKRVSNHKIIADVPRADIAAVQTPQVFQRNIITKALESAIEAGDSPTDDCGAVEALNIDIHAITGSYENIKITTQEDIAFGEAILSRREGL